MATRNRRHRANSLADIIPIPDEQVVDPNVSRYDMRFPQNWTVEQLRSELAKNSVPFRKTDKKGKLIQLCKDNGLINGTQTSNDNESSDQGQNNNGSEINILTTSVAELQQTVSLLSRTLDTLVQRNTVVNRDQTTDGTNMNNLTSLTALPGGSNVDPLINITRETVVGIQNPAAADFTRNSGSEISTTTTGTRTRFGFAAESLPFIETVHPTLRKQIIEGKDVNLAALLIPYYTGSHADSAEIIKDNVKPDPRLQNSLSLSQFIQAFGIYKNILCEVHPSRREELDLYERDIVDMASRYGGKGFYEYHRMFSAEAAAHLHYANRKVDWSVRNNKLFTTIFVNQRANTCSVCNSSLHVASFCPSQLDKKVNSYNSQSRASADIKGRPRVQFQGKEICNNYNGKYGCHNRRCTNLHICLTCKKEHPQHTCSNNVSKNLTPGNGNSQK